MWQRLDDIFNQALELDPERRATFVDEACGGNDALRREVLRLLAADASARDLPGLVAGAAERLIGEHASSLSKRRFGPYRIIEELGSGGMGTVFLGERDDEEFEKRVAIKVARGGITDDAGRARFRAERQILAGLEHPGIARLLDGGTTEDGLPYVVMEFIDGRPITEYADDASLSTRDRLWLFLEVCAAVQYAHTNLVIHRDLKPANILVTADGSPKLLDFGIAKLIDPEGGEPGTRTVGRLMTPEYASPEQIRGDAVGTGSDVYALGVLLYELLSGARPFELTGESAVEIERIVSTRDPSPPSRVARTGRLIDRDLDSIALKALRKSPARRYESVSRLADDIRAYLTGLPVSARPSSFAYRGGKFVRRHAWGVAAVLVILGISVAAAMRLAAERDVARLEARRAERVTDFVTGLFRVADPDESLGREITARELLDQGAERLREALADEPAVRVTMLSVIGTVYQNLGLYTDAESVLREALSIAVRTTGPDSEDATAVKGILDGVLWRLGQLDEAVRLAEEVLDVRRRNASSPTDVAGALISLGMMRRAQGDNEQALDMANEVIDLAGELDPRGRDSLTSLGLNERGLIHLDAARWDEAAADLERALELDQRIRPADHSAIRTTRGNLATVYIAQGRLDEAERALSANLEVARRVQGPRHDDVAVTLQNLSHVQKEKGDFEEAERLQLEALDIQLETRGPDAPIVASSYNALANLREDLGDPLGAIDWHRKALALSMEQFGPVSEQASLSYYNMGGAYRQAGELDSALVYQRRALQVDSTVMGPDHPFIAQDLRSLGVTLFDLERYGEAERLFRESLAHVDRVLAPDHAERARSRVTLADALQRQGRFEDAERLLREAREIYLATYEPDHWEVGLAESRLGEVLLKAGGREEAAELLRSGHRKLLEGRGAEHHLTIRAAEQLRLLESN